MWIKCHINKYSDKFPHSSVDKTLKQTFKNFMSKWNYSLTGILHHFWFNTKFSVHFEVENFPIHEKVPCVWREVQVTHANRKLDFVDLGFRGILQETLSLFKGRVIFLWKRFCKPSTITRVGQITIDKLHLQNSLFFLLIYVYIKGCNI